MSIPVIGANLQALLRQGGYEHRLDWRPVPCQRRERYQNRTLYQTLTESFFGSVPKSGGWAGGEHGWANPGRELVRFAQRQPRVRDIMTVTWRGRSQSHRLHPSNSLSLFRPAAKPTAFTTPGRPTTRPVISRGHSVRRPVCASCGGTYRVKRAAASDRNVARYGDSPASSLSLFQLRWWRAGDLPAGLPSAYTGSGPDGSASFGVHALSCCGGHTAASCASRDRQERRYLAWLYAVTRSDYSGHLRRCRSAAHRNADISHIA